MQGFLHALRESGNVTVSTEPPPDLDESVAEALREHDRARRRELPPDAPPLDLGAAYWGARMLYQACQLIIMRDVPPGVSRAMLTKPYDGERTVAAHYSVDLTLLYLPGLFRLAERVAPADPVLDDLKTLGSDWPLSSVGMSGLVPAATLDFLSDACLRALYTDRILEMEDTSRLEPALVKESVVAALGAYPEACPKISEALEALTP